MKTYKNFKELQAKKSPERRARIAARVKAFLDGFALGGLLPTRRPSAPTSFFPEDEPESFGERKQ